MPGWWPGMARQSPPGSVQPSMSFDPGTLLASLLVSSVGYILFSYGRKQRRMPQTALGVVMLVYPYFVSNVPLMLGLCVLMLGLLWGLVFLGL
jgi:hypothetical protein